MPYYPPSLKNSAETTSFLAGGDIQALTVQAAIAEVAAERARSGENTDITSLGTSNSPVTIKGALRVPNVSRFKIIATVDQFFNVGIWNKINFPVIVKDNYGQIFSTGFICVKPGIYFISLCLYLQVYTQGTIYLECRINGFPEALIAAAPTLPGGLLLGPSFEVEVVENDYLEIFIYPDVGCNSIASEGLERVFLKGRQVA